jgi:hypothetical protein
MPSLFSDPEIPRYIYIVGLLGIICLGIALISFIIFFSVYHEKIDTSVEPFKGGSVGYQTTNIITIVFFIIGSILSLFILYGHVLKQRKDPQVIFGPRSYIEFPENGEFFDIEQEESNIYKGRLQDIPDSSSNLNTDFL